jgi:hypothetical protein
MPTTRYRLVRASKIEGFIEVEGERKLLRERDCGGLSIKLYDAAGVVSCGEEYSQLRIHDAGRRVFEIRWDSAGRFKVVHYDPSDWERTLRAWPAPIPVCAENLIRVDDVLESPKLVE